MKRLMAVVGIVLLGLSLLAVSCGPKAAPAQSAADFYKGKTIDWTSPDEPGGTIDAFSRMLAPYLEQQTGATVVVTNLREAGGTQGFVYIYRAEPDGLHLGGATSASMWLNEIMGAPGTEDYDSSKFEYLGGACLEPMVFVVAPNSPYQSIAALQAGKGLVLGGTSAAGRYSEGAMAVAYVLDLDAKVVTGAKGESALRLAVQQQEIVGGMLGTSIALKAEQDGQVKPLFVMASKRDSLFPDLPAITELVNLSGDKLAAVHAWDNQSNSRVFMATPGTPADRVAFLRGIMSNIFKDASFQEQVNARVGYDNKVYLTGEEVQQMTDSLFQNRDQIKSLFQSIDDKYRA